MLKTWFFLFFFKNFKTEETEKIGDALDEIYLTDDIKLSIGDTFINIEQDEVEGNLEERKSNFAKELKTKKKNIEAIEKKMKKLKAELYAKFGTNINLDYS
jgi:prefoldin subunit 4